jgi:cell division initiation protein
VERQYHGGMDASQSALDSLRTVEFRETLKGYHRDDVDDYLEKAAVETEGLQEQLRQSTERLRKAAETIAQLETELAAKPEVQAEPVIVAAPVVADDTLQRTLVLAQKFVDETKADAEAQAARVVADAEAQARKVQAESEQRLREEIARLESNRSHLSHEVETMSHQLETERERLRSALSEMLSWVDGNLNTATDERSPVTNISGGQRTSSEVSQLRPSGSLPL